MNKKIVKILSIVVLFVCAIFLINNTVLATSGSGLVNKFDGTKGDVSTAEAESLITKVVGPVLSAVRIVATGIAVIMITFLGIKYMAAAPSEKANIKNQLITFTIGAIVVVATTTLLTIVKDFATGVFK